MKFLIFLDFLFVHHLLILCIQRSQFRRLILYKASPKYSARLSLIFLIYNLAITKTTINRTTGITTRPFFFSYHALQLQIQNLIQLTYKCIIIKQRRYHITDAAEKICNVSSLFSIARFIKNNSSPVLHKIRRRTFLPTYRIGFAQIVKGSSYSI